MDCFYCSRHFTKNVSRRNHERYCADNPERIESHLKRLVEERKLKRPAHLDDPAFKERQRQNQLGRKHSEETKALLAEKSRKHWADPSNKAFLSERMKDAVVRNPKSYSVNNVSGRVMNVNHRGFTLKGSWELLVARTLDDLNIIWEQPTVGIPYIWNGGSHLYFPDFYLPFVDRYIEVKGYERARDHAKWSAVCELILIKQNEITRLKQGDTEWLFDLCNRSHL